ncbi:MAG: hypothetical protein MGG11_10630 [Trichodesmium sp. MAG_R03]|nr:hypothetical protein [Trichodesmium sp. MAG_R03]
MEASSQTIAKVAAACKMLTHRGATARLLPSAFRPGRMSRGIIIELAIANLACKEEEKTMASEKSKTQY